jgi:hypothetical protein
MNDDRSEFNFNYERIDNTDINYHVLYDSKKKIVNEMYRYKNNEKDFFFLKENFKNSEDSDKIILNEFIKMLEDIYTNAKLIKSC